MVFVDRVELANHTIVEVEIGSLFNYAIRYVAKGVEQTAQLAKEGKESNSGERSFIVGVSRGEDISCQGLDSVLLGNRSSYIVLHGFLHDDFGNGEFDRIKPSNDGGGFDLKLIFLNSNHLFLVSGHFKASSGKVVFVLETFIIGNEGLRIIELGVIVSVDV
jgi:hypothetical protein